MDPLNAAAAWMAWRGTRRREKCVLQLPPLLLQQSNLFVQRLGLLLPTHAFLKVALHNFGSEAAAAAC